MGWFNENSSTTRLSKFTNVHWDLYAFINPKAFGPFTDNLCHGGTKLTPMSSPSDRVLPSSVTNALSIVNLSRHKARSSPTMTRDSPIADGRKVLPSAWMITFRRAYVHISLGWFIPYVEINLGANKTCSSPYRRRIGLHGWVMISVIKRAGRP